MVAHEVEEDLPVDLAGRRAGGPDEPTGVDFAHGGAGDWDGRDRDSGTGTRDSGRVGEYRLGRVGARRAGGERMVATRYCGATAFKVHSERICF